MTARLPVTLDVEGRVCAVLGGGDDAERKARELLDAGARVIVIAAELTESLRPLADSGVISWRDRSPSPGDLEGCFLAVDATWDDATNRRSWEEAQERGVLLNVIDRPERCHFTTPAIVRREPLRIAISTEGESPFVASSVRARVERLIGEEWGPLTALVGRLRRGLRDGGVAPERQRSIYRRLLRPDLRRQLREGDAGGAESAAAAVAAAPEGGPGRIALVGAGPGDPGLLTLAGQDLLAGADVVFHDALISPAVLALAGPDARVVPVGKRAGRRSPDQESITAGMIAAARDGLEVVRLKGGDPFIFGRGGEEVAEVAAAGIDVIVVPGVSSAVAAPATAGIPLTLRDVASSVAFVTARAGGGPVPSGRLESLAAAVDTLVVLMALADLESLAARLSSVLGGSRPAALICSATLPEELVVRGTLCDIAERARRAGAAAPATLIVGSVVAAAPPGVPDDHTRHRRNA